jgi:lysine 2,3-aminomutase
MAGTAKGRDFIEKIPLYLKRKMNDILETKGESDGGYQALHLQYARTEAERLGASEANMKHYEAAMSDEQETVGLRGVERLYRRCVVIETTMVCAAHCRYCLRANYDLFTLSEDELVATAKYLGSGSIKDEVHEVLITGGDPLIIPRKLDVLLEAIVEYAPNIKTARIATRLITQDPERIDNNVFNAFRKRPGLRLELATQINHPVEFFPEAVDRFRGFDEIGVKIYSQNVLLKGVNDELDTLVELYDGIRECNIEAHYLFHAIPLKGTHHLRPTVAKGIELARKLTASGYISGRAKPMFALMTEIGKITLYDGTVLGRNENNQILIQSGYSYAERMRWNPGYRLPQTAMVDENGVLRIWYLDGED